MSSEYRRGVTLPVPREPDDRDDSQFWTADVGAFEQGTPASRWALARFLVGHAVIDALARGLVVLAVVFAGLCVLTARVGHATFWAVLLGLVALAFLGARAALRGLLRRLAPADPRAARELRALVSATRADVLAELRRVGLPGRTWTMPALAVRFVGRRRRDTVARLRRFEVNRAVPQARIDALHLLLRDATVRPDTLRS